MIQTDSTGFHSSVYSTDKLEGACFSFIFLHRKSSNYIDSEHSLSSQGQKVNNYQNESCRIYSEFSPFLNEKLREDITFFYGVLDMMISKRRSLLNTQNEAGQTLLHYAANYAGPHSLVWLCANGFFIIFSV